VSSSAAIHYCSWLQSSAGLQGVYNMSPAAHSTTRMGDFTTDGISGSTPLSGTFAAQGYPLYIVIENNNNQATFWHSMYWALFQHMQLLCMATHASDELHQMHKTTEDLLGYLHHSPVGTQPSSSCDESAVRRGTRDGGCQISIHEALKVPLPVQSQPCLQGSHDITEEHRDHEAYDIYSAGGSDVSSSSHAVYDDSGVDAALHEHPPRRLPSLCTWLIWLLLMLFACFWRVDPTLLTTERSMNYTLAPRLKVCGKKNQSEIVQLLPDETQLPSLQQHAVNISGGSSQDLTIFDLAPTLSLTAGTAASTSAPSTGLAIDSSLSAVDVTLSLASTSSTTIAPRSTATVAALPIEPVPSFTTALGLPVDAVTASSATLSTSQFLGLTAHSAQAGYPSWLRPLPFSVAHAPQLGDLHAATWYQDINRVIQASGWNPWLVNSRLLSLCVYMLSQLEESGNPDLVLSVSEFELVALELVPSLHIILKYLGATTLDDYLHILRKLHAPLFVRKLHALRLHPVMLQQTTGG